MTKASSILQVHLIDFICMYMFVLYFFTSQLFGNVFAYSSSCAFHDNNNAFQC